MILTLVTIVAFIVSSCGWHILAHDGVNKWCRMSAYLLSCACFLYAVMLALFDERHRDMMNTIIALCMIFYTIAAFRMRERS
jgi:hypothetical protein